MSTTQYGERRPVFGQVLCVIAIALGTGLLVAGNSLNPTIGADELPQRISQLALSPREAEFMLGLSAALRGFGAAFLTLGILALVVPWINTLIHGRGRAEAAETPLL